MGNIKHNDELLRVHDDGFDVVFNCDNKHQNGVSYHAEKNGKKTKIDPEYAAASLVKKVGQGGWPSDLPKPSEGGYGYTTEVTNEVELTCERPEVDVFWSDPVEFPDELIIGESYEVTVNGVTGTYECFDMGGDLCLGYQDFDESREPGKWFIATWTYDGGTTQKVLGQAAMILRLGETGTIIISSIEFIVEVNQPEAYESWADEIEVPEGLIVGENYEVTVNGVTGTYECFNDYGTPKLGYSSEVMDQHEPGTWQIYSYEEDDTNWIGAGMNLRAGETATFVVKHVTHEDHRIEPKYLPDGVAGYDEISGGNITEIDGKKHLTPLGGGVFPEPWDAEFTVVATEDGITWGDEPIIEGELIVGETYRITVNGVTNDYVCYYDGDDKVVGTSESDFTPGDWQFVSFQGFETFVNVYGEVGEEFAFEVYGKVEAVHTIDSIYLPEIGGGSEPLIVTFTGDGDNVTCDRTNKEIYDAFPNVIVVNEYGDKFGDLTCDSDRHFAAEKTYAFFESDHYLSINYMCYELLSGTASYTYKSHVFTI